MNGTDGADAAITLESVSKRYAGRVVLDGVSLILRRGQCVALTGVNGCGKSTLLRVLGGITRADAGRVLRAPGLNVQYMPEAFPRLNLTLSTYLKAIERVDARDTLSLVRLFHLEAALSAPIRTFSKGMLSKVCAIQALSAHPDVLLLDEPLSGQDEASQAAFVEAVRGERARGAAIVVACHEKPLVDALADRVLRLESGRLIEQTDFAATPPGCLCASCPNAAFCGKKGGCA